eukprot:6594199-Karenia_brevis.AAC.1
MQWPFQVEQKRKLKYTADMSDDEENDTMQQKDMDEARVSHLWGVIKDNISCYMEDSPQAMLKLSDPSVFMMLGM